MAQEIKCPTCDDGSVDGAVTQPTTYTEFCGLKQKLEVGDNGCIRVTDKQDAIADGTYNTVTVVNGCIVSMGKESNPGYTPNPCCDEGQTQGEGAQVEVSALTCNLTSLENDGLYTRVHWDNSNGYSISGCGSAADPFTLTGPDIPDQLQHFADNIDNPVSLTGSGTATDNYIYAHDNGVLPAGDYENITLDAYGHVTEVRNIDTAELQLTSNDGTIDIVGNDLSLATFTTEQSFTIGGATFTVDVYGRISFTGTFAVATADVPYKKPDGTDGILKFEGGLFTGTA